jgi:type IV pilus assembly protein PilX
MMGMVKAAVLAVPQQGMVLMAALLVMVMLLLMGVSGARLAIQGEKSARGLRDRDIAMQAAEDALADAERELAGGSADPARNALLAAGDGYAEGCGNGATAPDLGLCRVTEGEAPAWQQVDIGDGSGASRSVPFGLYTGTAMETGDGFLPFRKPRYVIEQLPLPPGAAAGTEHVYRVTAIGFGARGGTEAVLQSTYRRAPPPGGARIAWREVANYRELRRAAKP